MSASARWEAPVGEVLEKIRKKNMLDEATVLLVGSAARNAQTPQSDIDVLVITPKRLSRWPTSPETQVFLTTRPRFLERLRGGDDFPHWVVRFGKVLSDRPHWWEELLRNPAIGTWPDWKKKRDQAATRLSFASRLCASGDYDHAEEEYVLSVRHLARALLLKSRTFPLSQPELPNQLRNLGYTDLVHALDSLMQDFPAPAALMQVENLLKTYLTKLSEEPMTVDGKQNIAP